MEHYLSYYKAWHSLSVVGFVGTSFNLHLLHSFYSERDIMDSSINALIYMDCCHKVLYSAIMVPWRNYNMITRNPLFISFLGLHEVIKKTNEIHILIHKGCKNTFLQFGWINLYLVSFIFLQTRIRAGWGQFLDRISLASVVSC